MTAMYIRTFKFAVVICCLGLFAGFLSASAASGDSPFEEAAALVEQAQQETDASNQAVVQGDQKAYSEHAAKAKDLLQQARNLYDSAHAADSDDTAVLRDYGSLLNKMEDYDLAEKALLRAVFLNDDEPDSWFALGETQAQLGQKDVGKAVKSFREALLFDVSPEFNAKVNAALGALFMQQGLFDFARQCLQDAVKENPAHVGATIALASLDVRDGQIGKASDSLDKLGNLAPGSLSLMQNSIEQALVDFERSRRWMPDTAQNHLAYAKLLVRVGRYQESVLPLERSVQLDPKDFVAWNLLGSVYRGLNLTERAREAFSKSLAVKPGQPRTEEALKELGPGPAHPLVLAPQPNPPASDAASESSARPEPEPAPQGTPAPETSPEGTPPTAPVQAAPSS